jgi:hypothetical protein
MTPIEVVQRERATSMGSQSIGDPQQQDGVIPSTNHGLAIHFTQHLLHLVDGDRSWNLRQPVDGRRFNGRAEIARYDTFAV